MSLKRLNKNFQIKPINWTALTYYDILCGIMKVSMKNMKCDIIIPIYNAYDCVKACVESVLKNTNFNKAHLILIDDKSPDERIVPLIEKYEKENPEKITVLKNEKNLGFVGTVNRGMKYSKNDVLLLNSDTEVPGGVVRQNNKMCV